MRATCVLPDDTDAGNLSTAFVLYAEEAVAAALSFRVDDLRAMFRDLSDPQADTLAHRVTVRLTAMARATDDWRAYAFAPHHMPTSARRQASRELCERFDAEIRRRGNPVDTPRRVLSRLTIRLIRNGAPGDEVLRLLDAANARLSQPLARAVLRDIVLWAARTARQSDAG